MSSSNVESAPTEAAAIEAAAAEQMIAAIRNYAGLVSAKSAYFPIVPESTLTATDAMIVATALLKAVNVQVFELGLWQSWGQK
jgi:hypothetical protein